MNNPSTCPHFSLCSGCQLAANIYEPPIWKEAQTYFYEHHIVPQFIHHGFSQTRLKAKLAVRPGPAIGLFKKQTHEVISIPNCLVHHPAINYAVALIKKEMTDQIVPYTESPPSGQLRYLQFFVEQSTGKIQLVLVVTQITSQLQQFCQRLLKYPLWHSIWLNLHPIVSNRVLGDRWELIHGPPFLWQTLNQTPIAFHPAAFSQTHLPLFEKMLQQIAQWVQPNEKILELYAGVGAIGLTLRHKTPHLALVENNPFAYLSFQQTKTNIPYHCIDAKDANLAPYDLIIIDPPRKGLDPALCKRICELPNGRLIYVSCGFESFQRDCNELLAAGWKFKEAIGYLLFPGTNHVEILSLLEK